MEIERIQKHVFFFTYLLLFNYRNKVKRIFLKHFYKLIFSLQRLCEGTKMKVTVSKIDSSSNNGMLGEKVLFTYT